MEEAIAKSCNTFFYTIGAQLDVDLINGWAAELGLGVLTGIDLPNESRGLVPSRSWKFKSYGEPWYPGESVSVAIGQGPVSVTPISLAVAMSTVSNGGFRITPRLVKALGGSDGRLKSVAGPRPVRVSLGPETRDALKQGLWHAVNGDGTGRNASLVGRDVLGKTGTAQVISIEARKSARESDRSVRHHGWFVFAAPRDNPQIAGAVLVEHSDRGSYAAPIARHVMDTYFAKREGKVMPRLQPPTVDEKSIEEDIPDGTLSAGGGG
jgi:penicillin-binding protein 2